MTKHTSVLVAVAVVLMTLASAISFAGESVDFSFQSKQVLMERVQNINVLTNFVFHVSDAAQLMKKQSSFDNVDRLLVAVRTDGKLRLWRVTKDGKTEVENSKVVLDSIGSELVPNVESGHILFGIPVHAESHGMPLAWKEILAANPQKKGCNPADDVLVSVWPDAAVTTSWPGTSLANKCGEMLLFTHVQLPKFISETYKCDKYEITDTKLSKDMPDKAALMEEWQANVCGSPKTFFTFFVLSREGRIRMFFSDKES